MKSLAKYLVAAGITVATAVTVWAEDGATQPPIPSLSGADMAERGVALASQVEDDNKQMAHLQAVARKAKDVVKLTCVNDLIVEAKAQRNIFDSSRQQFDAALAGDVDTARPHYEEMSGAADATKKLRGNAEACIGVPELYKQESDVQVTHPDFPDDPTANDPFVPDVEPPAYASPFA